MTLSTILYPEVEWRITNRTMSHIQSIIAKHGMDDQMGINHELRMTFGLKPYHKYIIIVDPDGIDLPEKP